MITPSFSMPPTHQSDPPNLRSGLAGVIMSLPTCAARTAAACAYWPDFARACKRIAHEPAYFTHLPYQWAAIALTCLGFHHAQAALSADDRDFDRALLKTVKIPLELRDQLGPGFTLTGDATACEAVEWVTSPEGYLDEFRRDECVAVLIELVFAHLRHLEWTDAPPSTGSCLHHHDGWDGHDRVLGVGEQAVATLYCDLITGRLGWPSSSIQLCLAQTAVTFERCIPRPWLAHCGPLNRHAAEALWRQGICLDDWAWLLTHNGLDPQAHAWVHEQLCGPNATAGRKAARLFPTTTFLLADMCLHDDERHGFVPSDREVVAAATWPHAGALVALIRDELLVHRVLDAAVAHGAHIAEPRCVERVVKHLGPRTGELLEGDALAAWITQLDDDALRAWLADRDIDGLIDDLDLADDASELLTRLVMYTPGLFALQIAAGTYDAASEAVGQICHERLGDDMTAWALLFQIGTSYPGPLDELLAMVLQCRR